MAIISLSDNAVFQIAACWMLPLAYAVVSLVSLCIKVVRLHVLPVASVAVVEATLVPSTNKSNAVSLRLNATACQLPSNAVPPEKPLAMTVLLPRARPKACDVVENWPICARSLVVDELEIARAALDIEISAALEEGEKSEIRVIQARYYGVVSARVTCYSIGSEACALLAGLSQPVIGVDRSSDSEVFRVTRGIG